MHQLAKLVYTLLTSANALHRRAVRVLLNLQDVLVLRCRGESCSVCWAVFYQPVRFSISGLVSLFGGRVV